MKQSAEYVIVDDIDKILVHICIFNAFVCGVEASLDLHGGMASLIS